MACNHPNEALIGTADGIYCSACGAKIEPVEPKPVKKAEPKVEPVEPKPVKKAEPKVEPDEAPAAEEKPKKATPKKGAKK